MDFVEFSAKTVDDAITEACQKLTVTSDKLEYEVIEEGSSGFLGIGAKPAVIKARIKNSVADKAKEFLKEVFDLYFHHLLVYLAVDQISKCHHCHHDK